ncbi:MAG: VacJ family lipoprotein [Alphaproteobacteria bacterium]|nr:VacJ family lipoprotein [Alphaproteobacteria bacterium]
MLLQNRSFGAGLLAGVLVLAAACATPPQDPIAREAFDEANDPLEPMNRPIFDFNLFVDRNVLKPLASAYKDVTPDAFQDAVQKFTRNLGQPLVFIHDLLQGEISRAGVTLARFVTNTVTSAGFQDLADEALGLEHHSEDAGQTLAVWGVSEGPFIMLPIFGPSSLRDMLGRVADGFGNPVRIGADIADISLQYTATGVAEGIDQRARLIEVTDDLEKSSLDYYAALRSLYRQDRDKEIRNGKAGPPTTLRIPD